MWHIIWTPAATREFDNLTRDVRESIYDALFQLAVHGRGDVTRLKGQYAGTFRLRVGSYRVRFDLLRDEGILLILGADPRGSAYKP